MSKIISTNPGKNYEVLGEVESSSEQKIKEKVFKAQKALPTWQALGIKGRIKALRKVLEALLARKEELALLATREMGMPITATRQDVDDATGFLKSYIENAEKSLKPEVVYEDERTTHTVYREPWGVAGIISPWNYPMSNFVWSSGQALLSGNTVVYKSSEEVPLFGRLLEEIVTSCLPDGVFNEIYGDSKVGKILLQQDINVISFTGSSKVGKEIYKVGGNRFIKVFLEMGGSSPGIVFEDADVGSVINSIYENRFSNSGQMCDALKRLIVHEAKLDEVVDKLKELLSTKLIGNPEDENCEIGPLVSKKQLKVLSNQVTDAIDKGANVESGGYSPDDLKGAYFLPTILTNVSPQMRVWTEEVFGPVLPVITFKTEEEAIQLANFTEYGLSAYIYSEDKEKVQRVASQLQAGMISVNNTSYISHSSPFGGYKDSGMGREHGKFGFEEYTQIKVVATPK